MANPIIRIKRGSSTPVSLSSGELAVDLTNLNLFVGKADGTPLTIGGSGTFATKAYADAAVSTANTTLTAAIAAEEAARIAADSTLTSNLSTEVSRATAAEGVIAANLATETSNRTSADTALDGKITTEKNRIDAILSASQADKDSFAEIVSLINSVDTENDTAFAGYVTSNNTRVTDVEGRLDTVEAEKAPIADPTFTGEVNVGNISINDPEYNGIQIGDVNYGGTAIQTTWGNSIVFEDTAFNGDWSFNSPLTVAAPTSDNHAVRKQDLDAVEARVTTAESDIVAEETARIAAVSAEASSRASADTTLQSNINAEATTRANADSALDSRVTALETTIDGGVY